MSKVNLKNTLNLPQTGFPMKANLPQAEPKLEDWWKQNKIYEKIQEKNAGNQKFILHDGPPYANGDIHIGHALNKILKDIIVRYKSMNGYDSPFVPGWDCHGLPVELQLLKKLNLKKHEIEKSPFRKKARDFALKFVDVQREQFKRLGIFGAWEEPYLTLDKSYESRILRALGGLVRKGFIYRSLKPVNWCYHCETALAEAEVEYQQVKSPSVFVKFEAKRSGILSEYKEFNVYFVIWTTTPWTLLANVACAVNPALTYCLVEVCPAGCIKKQDFQEKEIWIMADSLVKKVMAQAGIKDYKIIKQISAGEIEGNKYQHPFFNREGIIVTADYVSEEDGSGIVHTAPGHGQEDYITGVKYGLPVIMPVDEKGNFDKNQDEFSSLNVHKANPEILEKLRGLKFLIKDSEVEHSYPHCWRCKKPIIFRATNQYFMRIDHQELRKQMVAICDTQVKWIPPQGKERIRAMIEMRPDWCISRQRFWGIPIVAFYCQDCKEHVLDAKIIECVADLVEKEGSDIWFEKDESRLLPAGFKCPACGSGKFKKEEDILDVWFESGVSFKSVLQQRDNLAFPADLYLEGSDQHRGWFQSSLITSVALDARAPYRQVLTHGFVMDGEGRKMSKSLGNVITPHQIIKDKGADILRLWVASSDYNEDVRISDEILSRLSEAYRKIRNTFRFIMGNLYDFDKEKDLLEFARLEAVDRWILSKLYYLLDKVSGYYEDYNFLKAYQAIYNFCIVELSSFYLDILKDRLYTFAAKSSKRRSAQTALFYIIDVLGRIAAPLIPFTAEELWRHFDGKEIESVHLADWPRKEQFARYEDKNLETEFEKLLLLRRDVTKKLEESREKGFIGNSLEAKVLIYVKESSDNSRFMHKYAKELPAIFIVSQVDVKAVRLPDAGEPAQYFGDIYLKIEKAQGIKCARCWNYAVDVGINENYPEICSRCVEALS